MNSVRRTAQTVSIEKASTEFVPGDIIALVPKYGVDKQIYRIVTEGGIVMLHNGNFARHNDVTGCKYVLVTESIQIDPGQD